MYMIQIRDCDYKSKSDRIYSGKFILTLLGLFSPCSHTSPKYPRNLKILSLDVQSQKEDVIQLQLCI